MSERKGINLGDEFPDFNATTTEGDISFHKWLGGSWAILFSHPADYTPVCTTELGAVIKLTGEFEKRGVKLITLSCNSLEDHKGWSKDILAHSKQTKVTFPIIADANRELAVKFGMLDPVEKDSKGLPLTCRAFFIIGPDKKLKLSALYPATTGRNFNEILRVIDSLQLTATKKVATPANWEQGGKCMVIPSVTEKEAKQLFPEHVVEQVPSEKQYLRFTPQPK